jgi:hypothetical protein
MVRLEQNFLLILDVLNLLFLEKQIFVNTLHCIHFAHLTVRDKEYLAKATLINHLTNFKVCEVDLLTFEARFTN